jgi:hypothetical protein
MTTSQTYFIVSKGGVGEFSVFDEDNKYITVFSYKGWLSHEGSAPIGNEQIEIKVKDLSSRIFSIQKEGVIIGEIFFISRGNVSILLRDKENEERSLSLIQIEEKEAWRLEDETGLEILTMTPDSGWMKVDTRYTVVLNVNIGFESAHLLIACGYGTNLNTALVSSLMA